MSIVIDRPRRERRKGAGQFSPALTETVKISDHGRSRHAESRHFLRKELLRLTLFVKRLPFFILTGIGAGLIGYAFREAVGLAGRVRETYPLLLFTLPLVGIVIYSLYRVFHLEKKNGAKTVIDTVRGRRRVSLLQLPLVFVSSVLTHLAGGSAGREGAVLEMGGVLGNKAATLLHLDPKERRTGVTESSRHTLTPDGTMEAGETVAEVRRVAILCGMAGAFSALFVTPLAAVFFVLEITDRRKILHRFVPVLITSFISFGVVCGLGWEPTWLPLYLPDPLPQVPFVKTAILAAACGLLGRVFCLFTRQTPRYFARFLKNGYLRGAVGGTIIVTLTLLLGTTRFNGLGSETIQAALSGRAAPLDFFWKMIFTAITLGAGFKGGEIIPAFFVGSTFGAVLAGGIGFLPDLGGALGLVAILSAVAQAPIAAFVLGVELFGVEGTLYFAVAATVARLVSGKRGLYSRN